MRTCNAWKQRSRLLALDTPIGASQGRALICLVAVAGSLLAAGFARAEERKFIVMLAHSPKAFVTDGEPGEPPGGLLYENDVKVDYFNTGNDPNVLSFREFWEEVSYGDVTITGDVKAWIYLPWAFEVDPPNAPARASPADFIDLHTTNGNPFCAQHIAPVPFAYGAGENFCDCRTDGDSGTGITLDKCGALIILDLKGDETAGNPPPRGPGMPDFDPFMEPYGVPVWTPGERFLDVDNDKRWDGFDEKNDMMCHGIPEDDCNENDILDVCDIDCDALFGSCDQDTCGNSTDNNDNGIPDECDCDCCPCEGEWDCPCNGRNNAPPCGCYVPGCGDLDMPFIDWDGSGEANNCGDDCVTPNDYVEPTNCLPPTEEDECSPELRECCAAGLAPEALEECIAGGGLALCADYPNQQGCSNGTPGLDCQDSGNPPIMCCEYHDFDENNRLNVVEPFEDFMIRWNPDGSSPGSVWVPVDDAYVIANYPGDVDALLKRTGNGYYDSPDLFYDAGNTKMMQEAGIYQDAIANTLHPPWYRQAWTDRYGADSFPPPWPLVGRSPQMREFDPDNPVPPSAGGATDRRWFRSNAGGFDGFGQGYAEDPFYEVNLGMNDARFPVLPEEEFGYYDGWVEHDDLPSSKYHHAGDKRLGEVTSPFQDKVTLNGVEYPAISGVDLGRNNPSAFTPDNLIIAAGPYAVIGKGFGGYDAGNVLLMEWLTWRTGGLGGPSLGYQWEIDNGPYHPYAGPSGMNLGFRDYNLDGMIDQGEVRPVLSENYSVDSDPDTENDGMDTLYPFNRRRMLEDVVEALDSFVDWDDWIDANSMRAVLCGGSESSTVFDPAEYDPPGNDYEKVIPAQGFVSGIVLTPPGSYGDPDLFPSAPRYYRIHNEDNDDPTYMFPDWPAEPFDPTETHRSFNLWFHDLVMRMDGRAPFPSVINYSAHEYGHTWERFPDLYDYDVIDGGGEINLPVGQWDLMAGGGLVHFVPPLKAGLAKPDQCTDWIEPIDLTTVLTPGVDTVVTLPPAAYVRDSYYYIENEAISSGSSHERLYFWSAGSGFDAALPGAGMLILHTNMGPNLDAEPPQQREEPFTWLIVQADGLHELEAGDDNGDAGDPWPGTSNNTEFDCWTNPGSQWNALNACTGLEFSDLVPDGDGSVRVTFNWRPMSIPGLRFVQPPGGESVGDRYEIRFQANDLYGGTWIRFFYAHKQCSASGTVCTTEADCPGVEEACLAAVSVDPNEGNFIGMHQKTTGGMNEAHTNIDWNIATLPDNQYYLFAELIPGPGLDGSENSVTVPRAGRQNVGDGTLNIDNDDVNTNEVVAAGPHGDLGADNTSFRARTQPGGAGARINFQAAGVEVGDQLAITGFASDRAAMRTISAIENDGLVIGGKLRFDTPITYSLSAYAGTWLITKANRTARSETWKVEFTDTTGNEWIVSSSLTQPEPEEGEPVPNGYLAHTGERYTSVGGEVAFTITEGTLPFGRGDTFVFTTTGMAARSSPVTIRGGDVQSNPTAGIVAAPLSGFPPLTVTFDGRSSFDPQGQPLEYRWDFGDNSTIGTRPVETHEYNETGDFTVTLTVTNPDNLSGEDQVPIHVINNSPNAVVLATPTNGPAPLDVAFDASQSSDQTDEREDLIFHWDFGDGTTANGALEPGETFVTVDHAYINNVDGVACTSSDPCFFVATLTVYDTQGGSDYDEVEIRVGNSDPVPAITYSSLQGPDPWEVIFNAIGSTDPDNDTLTAEWKWDDGSPDETWPVTGPDGVTGAVRHTFILQAGETSAQFHPTAIVRDGKGGEVHWAGVTVIVSEASVGPSDPRAIFHICAEAPCGQTDSSVPRLDEPFAVDATLSFDRPTGGLIEAYYWDFGDATVDTGVVATHTYTTPGNYTITLTVADGEDPPNTHSTFHPVSVGGEPPPPCPGGDPPPCPENNPPTAVLVVNPLEGFANQTEFTFDARSSADQDVGDELTYTWTFGDGTVESGSLVTHVYEEPGTYLVRLTVRDSQNASTDATQAVTVSVSTGNKEPVAIIATGPRTGTAPVTLTFDGRTSYDPDGDLLEYNWEFRLNGVLIDMVSGATVTRMFDMPGTYTVELEVSDGRGGVSRSESELVEVIARVVGDVDEEVERPTDDENGVIRSDLQRPSRFCGFGMLLSLFGTFLGLSATVATRRRSR